MTNWKEIHLDFTEELQKEWKIREFDYEQTKELIDTGLKITDADYAKWLRDSKKVNVESLLNHGNNEQLRKEYENYSISRWHSKGFTDEEIMSWISVGLELSDGDYVTWMRDISKITPNEYLNYLGESNSDKLLREQHQEFLEERKTKSRKEKSGWEEYRSKNNIPFTIALRLDENESKKMIEKIESLKILGNEDKKNRDVCNILLIGHTKSGKSTLANVITDTESFGVGHGVTSETKNIQVGRFENNGVNYQAIDTVGNWRDTNLSNLKVLYKLRDIDHYIKEGINQIFLVINDRFDKEVYKLLKSVIFDENIDNYITVIRTKFGDFEDRKKLKESIETIKKFIESISDDQIIHVNNRDINIENEEKRGKRKAKRVETRKRLLNHLEKCREIYKIGNGCLNERIRKYLEEVNINLDDLPDLLKENESSYLESRKKICGDSDFFEELKKRIEEQKNVGSDIDRIWCRIKFFNLPSIAATVVAHLFLPDSLVKDVISLGVCAVNWVDVNSRKETHILIEKKINKTQERWEENWKKFFPEIINFLEYLRLKELISDWQDLENKKKNEEVNSSEYSEKKKLINIKLVKLFSKVLDRGNLEQLSQEFVNWWQERQLQTQIEQPLK